MFPWHKNACRINFPVHSLLALWLLAVCFQFQVLILHHAQRDKGVRYITLVITMKGLIFYESFATQADVMIKQHEIHQKQCQYDKWFLQDGDITSSTTTSSWLMLFSPWQLTGPWLSYMEATPSSPAPSTSSDRDKILDMLEKTWLWCRKSWSEGVNRRPQHLYGSNN